ncbi:hypothetical protein CIG75_02700 [Tumebacillus algifaecis]|uniref:Uncharacterized protein n=1 Tax=Tumebacillus algifaecis TaxID=1214604 RepID=A0A223CXR6_9BACL|nr:hypothetical protein CIG75_02700 [Tumebacillus algifaecis]
MQAAAEQQGWERLKDGRIKAVGSEFGHRLRFVIPIAAALPFDEVEHTSMRQQGTFGLSGGAGCVNDIGEVICRRIQFQIGC